LSKKLLTQAEEKKTVTAERWRRKLKVRKQYLVSANLDITQMQKLHNKKVQKKGYMEKDLQLFSCCVSTLSLY